MCGIAGELRFERPADQGLVSAMMDMLAHRGPDGAGIWAGDNVCLGHRRLSVLDPSAAAGQPMINETGRFVIVYNGEIYNFRELRQALLQTGERFCTTGDTEVVLKLFARHGPETFALLNGMFAIAIWDRRDRRLTLARDRMGEKPLYYARLPDGGLAFASELKAMRLRPDIDTAVDAVSLGRYLAAGYTIGERTILAAVRRLPPASTIMVDCRGVSGPALYWDLAGAFRRKRRWSSFDACAEEARALLWDATRLRLESDVPLGAFLSGGIDSAGVVAGMCAAAAPGSVRTFSAGFADRAFTEIDQARATANALGCAFDSEEVSTDLARDVPRILYEADEPFGDSSIIPTYYLARFARRKVTVALSGDGGDELFGGYETYVADLLHAGARRAPRPAVALARIFAERVLPTTHGKVSFDYKLRQFLKAAHQPFERAHWSWRNMFDEEGRRTVLSAEWRAEAAPHDGFDEVSRCFAALPDAHPLDRAMFVDMKTWLVDDVLVKVDRATMAHGLESRAPYLDHRLVEFAASVPVEWKVTLRGKKLVLRRALDGHVPAPVLARRKAGFNAPIARWLKAELRDLLRDTLSSGRAAAAIHGPEVDRLCAEHDSGRADHGHRLYNLLSLGAWLNNPPSAARISPRDRVEAAPSVA